MRTVCESLAEGQPVLVLPASSFDVSTLAEVTATAGENCDRSLWRIA